MARRKSLSKKVRFEVFKGNNFACQYCGDPSPDVALHVDHIKPICAGGSNAIENLITSCADCNLGKADQVFSKKMGCPATWREFTWGAGGYGR